MPLDAVRDLIARAATHELDDLFGFEFAGPPQPLTGPPGGGLRIPIQTLLGGARFVRFGVDVNSFDAVVGEPERHPSDPLLACLGFPTSEFPVYPLAQQFAEKLHAFTRPRDQENTRVKDLADLVWYIERYGFASAKIIEAGEETFARRGEHPWPPSIPDVPNSWARPYGAYRAEMRLGPATAAAARADLARFVAPVLADDRQKWSAPGGAWSPEPPVEAAEDAANS